MADAALVENFLAQATCTSYALAEEAIEEAQEALRVVGRDRHASNIQAIYMQITARRTAGSDPFGTAIDMLALAEASCGRARHEVDETVRPPLVLCDREPVMRMIDRIHFG